MSLWEYDFIAQYNKKEDVKCSYLFNLKSKFSASFSRSNCQSIVNLKTELKMLKVVMVTYIQLKLQLE